MLVIPSFRQFIVDYEGRTENCLNVIDRISDFQNMLFL